MNQVYAQDRHEWRAWLEQHYATEKEVYLVYFKKGSGHSSISYEESVEEALCFGWIDGVRKPLDAERYMLRFTPRKARSMWSASNVERVERLSKEGLMTEAGLKPVEEAKADGRWAAAYSMKAPQVLPPDLEAALRENHQAWENFHRFSNSVQFTFIRRVDKIKGAALRQERIQKAVELCAQNLKPDGPEGKRL